MMKCLFLTWKRFLINIFLICERLMKKGAYPEGPFYGKQGWYPAFYSHQTKPNLSRNKLLYLHKLQHDLWSNPSCTTVPDSCPSCNIPLHSTRWYLQNRQTGTTATTRQQWRSALIWESGILVFIWNRFFNLETNLNSAKWVTKDTVSQVVSC